MNFILTSYIYPIKEKIPLSKKLGVYFDNPRNHDEIEKVMKYIENSNDHEKYTGDWHQFIALSRDQVEGITDDYWVADFTNLLADIKSFHNNDDYIVNFLDNESKNIKSNIYETIAKSIIVIRFDDQGTFTVKRDIEKSPAGGKVLHLIDDDDDALISSKNAVIIAYFLYVVSFEDNGGRTKNSFLLHEEPFTFIFQEGGLDKRLLHNIFETIILYHGRSLGYHKDEDARFTDFNSLINSLSQNIDILDSHLEKYGNLELQKILYIGERLKEIEKSDEKNQLLGVVGLIELLLTHNPDHNRFNVEDSINKQFISKIIYVLYVDDNTIDLGETKKELKNIYNLRSNIAHGNFGEINKYLQELKKEDKFFEKDIFFVRHILHVIIKHYLRDKKFIDHLKEN